MHAARQGVFTWRDGKKYEGVSVNGKHQGKGKFWWPVSVRAVPARCDACGTARRSLAVLLLRHCL